MAKNDSIYRYSNSDTESTPKQKEAEVVPQIPKEAERNVEEYEPPKINRKQLPDLKDKGVAKKLSIFTKGGESR